MELKVTTQYSRDIIKQSIQGDSPMKNITEQIIDLREQGVIDALIALGWTPPKD